MKTLLVTSDLTFVPFNYNRFVLKMAEDTHIVGLIIIKNKSFSILLKALVLIFSGAGTRLGAQLIKNYFSNSDTIRKKKYLSLGKKVWSFSTINLPEVLQIIKDEEIDLIVNARTREIFKMSLLQAPKWGCVNIHHGLLPKQRGLMCDFWAHLEGDNFGFSIHRMTSKIDDGDILKVYPFSQNYQSYLEAILNASIQEAVVCSELLSEINKNENKVLVIKNKSDNPIYFKNPKIKDFQKLNVKGIKI